MHFLAGFAMFFTTQSPKRFFSRRIMYKTYQNRLFSVVFRMNILFGRLNNTSLIHKTELSGT